MELCEWVCGQFLDSFHRQISRWFLGAVLGQFLSIFMGNFTDWFEGSLWVDLWALFRLFRRWLGGSFAVCFVGKFMDCFEDGLRSVLDTFA